MSNLENNGLTITSSLSNTFRFGSLNNNFDNDDYYFKNLCSIYKYNFVILLLLTYYILIYQIH